MSNRDAKISLAWADGDYVFRLPWGMLIELQQKFDCGPNYILQKFWEGNWKVEYISEVIRLGLIGGGEKPSRALELVRSYVENRPPLENLSVAQAILAIALAGAPEEDSGELKAATEKSELTTSPEEKSE